MAESWILFLAGHPYLSDLSTRYEIAFQSTFQLCTVTAIALEACDCCDLSYHPSGLALFVSIECAPPLHIRY